MSTARLSDAFQASVDQKLSTEDLDNKLSSIGRAQATTINIKQRMPRDIFFKSFNQRDDEKKYLRTVISCNGTQKAEVYTTHTDYYYLVGYDWFPMVVSKE